jgi:hypothetical protein
VSRDSCEIVVEPITEDQHNSTKFLKGCDYFSCYGRPFICATCDETRCYDCYGQKDSTVKDGTKVIPVYYDLILSKIDYSAKNKTYKEFLTAKDVATTFEHSHDIETCNTKVFLSEEELNIEGGNLKITEVFKNETMNHSLSNLK